MTEAECLQRWLFAFGQGVPEAQMEAHVTSKGGMPWHLFSWKLVPCLEGDAAREKFDGAKYRRAIRFHGDFDHPPKICNIAAVGKLTSAEIDREAETDVYIVAEDFSWTYVHTHEEYLGPYFCERK